MYAAAATCPAVLLPGGLRIAGEAVLVDPLLLTSPNEWTPLLNGPWGIAIALGCWWLWCVGLMPRTWYPRHGWWRAVRMLW